MMNTYICKFYRISDIATIEGYLIKEGVKWYKLIEMPNYNNMGELTIGKMYTYVYIHDKELSIEVLT